MKKLIVTAITFCLLSNAFALDYKPAESSQEVQYSIISYEYGLFSENESVVASSMQNVILFHAINPDENFAKIANRLDYLVISANSTALRHKAYIASLYFRNPEWFVKQDLISLCENEENPEQFFEKLFESAKCNLYAGK